MNTRQAIASRRSIRRFRPDPIPREALTAILSAAIQAPSAHNWQPWRLVVVEGEGRKEMVGRLRQGIAAFHARGENTGSAEGTARIMEQAPVTVFVFNPLGIAPQMPRSVHQQFTDLVNLQSIGAAIQNMLLAAQDLGIGSLWIGDVLYAYQRLCQWLGEPGEMVAAVTFGYPDEQPEARPRLTLEEVARWI